VLGDQPDFLGTATCNTEDWNFHRNYWKRWLHCH